MVRVSSRGNFILKLYDNPYREERNVSFSAPVANMSRFFGLFMCKCADRHFVFNAN